MVAYLLRKDVNPVEEESRHPIILGINRGNSIPLNAAIGRDTVSTFQLLWPVVKSRLSLDDVIWQVVGADAVHILAYLLTDPDVIAFYSPNVLFGGTDGTAGAVGNGAQRVAGYLAQNYRLQINLAE